MSTQGEMNDLDQQEAANARSGPSLMHVVWRDGLQDGEYSGFLKKVL